MIISDKYTYPRIFHIDSIIAMHALIFPQTAAGMRNLLARVEYMRFKLQPAFVTLTWRSAFTNERLWVEIGATIQKEFKIPVLMHLTCHLPKRELERVLRNARKAGIRNILALRGDPPIGSDAWVPAAGGFSNAHELVSLIREKHGDYFSVAVAGYPEAHTESWNDVSSVADAGDASIPAGSQGASHGDGDEELWLPPSDQAKALDLSRLAQKVGRGANFIITQFFYDVGGFLQFVRDCRQIGIQVPILPGYMPI